VLANPFPMNDSVFAKTVEAADQQRVSERDNLSFHRQTSHPLVDKHDPAMAPGWNSSNSEVTANGRSGCYVLFDRSGRLVFAGRLTFDEVEALVAKTLRLPRDGR